MPVLPRLTRPGATRWPARVARRRGGIFSVRAGRR